MQLIPERARGWVSDKWCILKIQRSTVKVKRVGSTPRPLQAKVGVRLCALTRRFPAAALSVNPPTVNAHRCGSSGLRESSRGLMRYREFYAYLFLKNGCVIFACARCALCWSHSPAPVSCSNRCSGPSVWNAGVSVKQLFFSHLRALLLPAGGVCPEINRGEKKPDAALNPGNN